MRSSAPPRESPHAAGPGAFSARGRRVTHERLPISATPATAATAATPPRAPLLAHALLVLTPLGAALVTWLPSPRDSVRLLCLVLIAIAIPAFAVAVRAARRTSWNRLLVVGMLTQLAVFPALPFTSHDVWANLAYGRILALGGNPFLRTPLEFFGDLRRDPFAIMMDSRWQNTACVYGPIVAGADWLIAAVSATPEDALFLMKSVATFVGLVTVALAWLYARRFDQPAGFALLALNPLFAWELSGQAHNDVFLVPLLVGFVHAVLRDRPRAVAVTAAASMLVKPIVLPALALYLALLAFQRRWKDVLAALALCALVLVAGWAPFWSGPETLIIVARSLVGGHVDATNSLAEALRNFGLLHSKLRAETLLVIWRTASLGLCALVGVFALRRIRSVEDVIDDGLFLLLLLLGLVAWFQPWYITWTLPFAALARNRRLGTLAAFYGATFLLGYLTGLYALSWIFHATMLVLLARESRHRGRPAPVAPALVTPVSTG